MLKNIPIFSKPNCGFIIKQGRAAEQAIFGAAAAARSKPQ